VQVKAAFSGRTLLLTCFDLSRGRYAGMRRVLGELAAGGSFRWESWTGGGAAAARFPGVREAILCGHGAAECPRLGDGEARFLMPAQLALPRRARLYLLGCYQGRDELRGAWERGTGVAPGNARGADGETETLLSTLFLLHLTEGGGTEALFAQWAMANSLIRPLFEPARELYAHSGGDPLRVLSWLEETVDLSPVCAFLALARRKPEYLAGLLDVQ
jgi:hypothetical protein